MTAKGDAVERPRAGLGQLLWGEGLGISLDGKLRLRQGEAEAEAEAG